MLRLGIQKGFVLLDLVSLPQEWKAVFGGFFPCLKPSGLHFGVKVLIKPFYKSNHLETHNVWYTCFSLDFSCVTCSYSQIFFFSKNWRDVSTQILLEINITFFFMWTYVYPTEHCNRYRDPKGLCLDLCELPVQRLSEKAVSFLPGRGRCLML